MNYYSEQDIRDIVASVLTQSGAAKVSGGQDNRSSDAARPGARAGQVRAYWMGRRISGAPNCANTALSQYSTKE